MAHSASQVLSAAREVVMHPLDSLTNAGHAIADYSAQAKDSAIAFAKTHTPQPVKQFAKAAIRNVSAAYVTVNQQVVEPTVAFAKAAVSKDTYIALAQSASQTVTHHAQATVQSLEHGYHDVSKAVDNKIASAKASYQATRQQLARTVEEKTQWLTGLMPGKDVKSPHLARAEPAPGKRMAATSPEAWSLLEMLKKQMFSGGVTDGRTIKSHEALPPPHVPISGGWMEHLGHF